MLMFPMGYDSAFPGNAPPVQMFPFSAEVEYYIEGEWFYGAFGDLSGVRRRISISIAFNPPSPSEAQSMVARKEIRKRAYQSNKFFRAT
jgi:hypothetical protein